MASREEEIEPSSIPKLPLFSTTQLFHVQSPARSGMLTPPLARVPFGWEEEPGKPRPCTAIIPRPQDIDITKRLELPPRLFSSEQLGTTKSASPTTVLDAPMFDAPSFRFITSPEKGQLGAIVLGNRSSRHRSKRGWFASWGRKLNLKGKRADDEDDDRNSFIFPRSSSFDGRECERDYDSEGCGSSVKVTSLRRSGSFLGFAHSRSSYFLGAIYGGLKQILPGKGNKKLKKDGFSM